MKLPIDPMAIESTYDKLLEFKKNLVVTNKEHVQEIRKMKEDIGNNICPRCGAKLMLRTSKTNNRTFWGCSNFPKCRFIKNNSDS